jgi:hypothetical protein
VTDATYWVELVRIECRSPSVAFSFEKLAVTLFNILLLIDDNSAVVESDSSLGLHLSTFVFMEVREDRQECLS